MLFRLNSISMEYVLAELRALLTLGPWLNENE